MEFLSIRLVLYPWVAVGFSSRAAISEEGEIGRRMVKEVPRPS
jgi:hypothetical protein